MTAAAASHHVLSFSRAVAGSERSVILAFSMFAVGAMLAWPVLKIAIAAGLSVLTLQMVQARA